LGLQWQENLLLVAWLLLNFEGIVSGTEKFHVYFQTDGNCLRWIEMSLPFILFLKYIQFNKIICFLFLKL
jgi:hypothetical protein